MKIRLIFAAAFLLSFGAVLAADGAAMASPTGLAFGKSTGAEILEGAYREILRYEELGLDVPEEMYAFYFAAESLVHPEFYEGRSPESGALDEFPDVCPGTTIVGPSEGQLTSISYGQTNNAHNDCSYPDCRWGRDVVIELDVQGYDEVTITTTGSAFDTYLCLYEDACCGDEGSVLLEQNNNNPSLCNGQRLAAGIQTCLDPGTYWVVLDGAGPAARGSYCLTVEFQFYGCE